MLIGSLKTVGTKAAEFVPPLPSKCALVRGKVVAGIETQALLCPCGGEGGGDSDSDGGRESGREDSGEDSGEDASGSGRPRSAIKPLSRRARKGTDPLKRGGASLPTALSWISLGNPEKCFYNKNQHFFLAACTI